jgi:uncharacterized protein
VRSGVGDNARMRFREVGPALVGVIHLPPLPGSPRSSLTMRSLRSRTAEDALSLASAGFDAVLIENFGDAPFYRDAVPPETVAAMAVLAEVARGASGLPLGVNVLRNDAAAALAVAAATDARFIRVNILSGARVADQGIIQTDAARLLRMRRHLDATHVSIIADVGVKHSSPLGACGDEAVAAEAVEVVERALADVVIVTGTRTGAEVDLGLLASVRGAVRGHPVWLGSGVRADTAAQWAGLADGAIVGSALREGGLPGGPVDPALALNFARAWRGGGA